MIVRPMAEKSVQKSSITPFTELVSDLDAEADFQRHQLQEQIYQLVVEVNDLQSEAATEQHDFLTQKERLICDLARIKLSEALKIEKATVDHHTRLTQLRVDHANSIASLAQSPISRSSVLPFPSRSQVAETHTEEVNSLEQSFDEVKGTSIPNSELTSVLNAQLKELSRQKANFLNDMKLNEQARMSQLVELISDVDSQNTDSQQEINEFQNDSAVKESEYRVKINSLTSEITKLQERRENALQRRQQQFAVIHSEIDAIEREFGGKMEKATRIAEKLRLALGILKQRKQERVMAEKQRSAERSRLLKENSALRRKVFVLENQVSRAQRIVSGLRREVSATVGPRVTASLFL
jgi:hypothetical protein